MHESDVAEQHRQLLGLQQAELVARARARSVRIAPIEDAGHGIPFEQPARLVEVVQSFLRELPR